MYCMSNNFVQYYLSQVSKGCVINFQIEIYRLFCFYCDVEFSLQDRLRTSVVGSAHIVLCLLEVEFFMGL